MGTKLQVSASMDCFEIHPRNRQQRRRSIFAARGVVDRDATSFKFPLSFRGIVRPEGRNVGKNPISHSISCPVREILPRATLSGVESRLSANRPASSAAHPLNVQLDDYPDPEIFFSSFLLTRIGSIRSIEAPIHPCTPDSLDLMESSVRIISCTQRFSSQRGWFWKNKLEIFDDCSSHGASFFSRNIARILLCFD